MVKLYKSFKEDYPLKGGIFDNGVFNASCCATSSISHQRSAQIKKHLTFRFHLEV